MWQKLIGIIVNRHGEFNEYGYFGATLKCGAEKAGSNIQTIIAVFGGLL